MELLVLFLVLIAIAVAAPRYGVDSRAPHAPRQATPAADLAALRRVHMLRLGRRADRRRDSAKPGVAAADRGEQQK
jgi:hypothetical protein